MYGTRRDGYPDLALAIEMMLQRSSHRALVVASVVIVWIATSFFLLIIFMGALGHGADQEQGRMIQVCEIEPQLIVTIPESAFNEELYSINQQDCT